MVLKPDAQTPYIALWAAALLDEAGLPPALLQVVTGRGAELGTPLIDATDYLMFTGSTATGKIVAAQAAAQLKDCSMELGGKNPLLVLPDAGLRAAVAGAVRGICANSGQLCISIERLYVHTDLYDAFVPSLAAALRDVRLGAALDFSVDMGSLASADQLAKVSAHVDDAVAKGAEVLAGGHARPDLGPYFYEPTLLAGVTDEMALCRDETFGPVAAVYRCDSLDEMVRRANDTDVRPERQRVDARRPPGPRGGGAAAGRHRQHKRGLRRRLGLGGRADGRLQRVGARPPPRRAGHPQIHRGADRRRGAPAAHRHAAAA